MEPIESAAQDRLSRRSALRREAVARREALPEALRQAWQAEVERRLAAAFLEPLSHRVTGFCWPYRGEIDPRPLVARLAAAGGDTALCALAPGERELSFRRWRPGEPLTAGAFGIPIPAGGEPRAPEALLVPMNAFDERGYRLGYGGGFFDRYLAARAPRPIAIGLAFEMARLPTLEPTAKDLPMDFIVTERAIYAATGERIVALAPAAASGSLQALAVVRGLGPEAPALSSPVCYASEFPGHFGETGETGAED